MKRYLFGIIAVVFALVLSSFTTKPTTTGIYVFEYDPSASGGYDELDVEDESSANWKFIGMDLLPCANNQVRACRVHVTSAYVDDADNPTALSGVTISAAESSSGTAYVSGITASGTNTYSNKQ